jgi:hypothetical protein
LSDFTFSSEHLKEVIPVFLIVFLEFYREVENKQQLQPGCSWMRIKRFLVVLSGESSNRSLQMEEEDLPFSPF